MPPVRLPRLVVSLIQPARRLSHRQLLESGLSRVTLTNAVVNWETLAMARAIRFSVRKEISVRWVRPQKLLSPLAIFTTKLASGTPKSAPQASTVLRLLVRLLRMSRTVIGQPKERVLASKTNVPPVTNAKFLRAQLDRTKKLVRQVNTREPTQQPVVQLLIVATEMFVTSQRKTSVQMDSTVIWTAQLELQVTPTPNSVLLEPITIQRPQEQQRLKIVSSVRQEKPVW